MAGLLATLGLSVLSKVGEKLAECGWEAVTGKKDSKFMLENLQRGLNSLSDKACDIKEQIRHGEQLGKKKRKREVENWLKEVQKMESELSALQNAVQEEGFLGRFFGEGGLVSELNTRVCKLVDQSRHFGELLLVARENRGELLLTTPLTGEMFEKNVKVIWEWLVNDKVKTIGIYGMGGVGKTTLAKHINNRLRNENRRVYWVTVSQVFTTNKLQSDIAKVVDLDLSDEENEDKRAARLNQALSKKEEFVLILDDVWSDIDLEKMGDPLRVEGCRLIVTTRSSEVCQRIYCEQKIEVKTLQTKESWMLFRESLGGRTKITLEVEEIAMLVAEECDGLPLGIIVLAKTMNGRTDICEWRKVYDEICELDEMKEKVFGVLKYSFDQLHPKLQSCFLYCSLYPEDHEIEKDELVKRFISEELLGARKSRERQLDLGYAVLSKLVYLCLLESTGYDSNCVKMHDLGRDMALSIARESPKYKVFAGLALKEIPNEGEWTEDVDKISLMRNRIKEIPIGMAPNCPKLATLYLNENPLESIPESFFVKMSGLRSLDLSFTSIRELPNSLSDLERLNILLLNHCEHLVCLPFLGKLKALRELGLSHISIQEMPKGMENLIHLEILLLRGTKKLKLQPGDLRIKSRNLQHLEFPLQIEVPVHEIESFKQLNTFVGRFIDISDFNWFQSQTGGLISKFSCLVKNKFDDRYDSDLFYEDGNCLRMDGCSLLDDFKLCSSSVIETLIIKDCEGIEGGLGRLPCPPPQAAMIFSSLKILCISSCHKMKKLGLTLPCLHNITRIEVRSCGEIEELIELDEDYEKISEPNHSLPKLYYLSLEDLPKLKSICKARIDCKSIERIYIDKCPSIKKLGLSLHDITSIEVRNCGEIEELIEDYEDISEPTHSLPKFNWLSLNDLPKLKSICKARIDCKSIAHIWILRCPRVEKLPLFLPSSTDGGVINYSPPPALRRIEIEEELWESLEWDDDIRHKHLLQPFVTYLNL